MYKYFKQFINKNISEWMEKNAINFEPIKSLSKRGVTFRSKCGKNGAVFLMVEHEPQRDRFSMSGGWATDIRFTNREEVDSELGSMGSGDRAEFRRRARDCPKSLFENRKDGILLITDLKAGAIDCDIAVSEGVPYKLIAEMLAKNPELERAIEGYLGSYTVDSLMKGEVPPYAAANPNVGLDKPYQLVSPLISWESWFGFIQLRVPTEAELIEIVGPALDEAIAQVQNSFINALSRICESMK
jgi:hypothetical protein